MHFNTDISLGNMLSLGAMLLTFYQFHRSNIKRIDTINFKVELMWRRFAKRFDLPEQLEDKDS